MPNQRQFDLNALRKYQQSSANVPAQQIAQAFRSTPATQQQSSTTSWQPSPLAALLQGDNSPIAQWLAPIHNRFNQPASLPTPAEQMASGQQRQSFQQGQQLQAHAMAPLIPPGWQHLFPKQSALQKKAIGLGGDFGTDIFKRMFGMQPSLPPLPPPTAKPMLPVTPEALKMLPAPGEPPAIPTVDQQSYYQHPFFTTKDIDPSRTMRSVPGVTPQSIHQQPSNMQTPNLNYYSQEMPAPMRMQQQQKVGSWMDELVKRAAGFGSPYQAPIGQGVNVNSFHPQPSKPLQPAASVPTQQPHLIQKPRYGQYPGGQLLPQEPYQIHDRVEFNDGSFQENSQPRRWPTVLSGVDKQSSFMDRLVKEAVGELTGWQQQQQNIFNRARNNAGLQFTPNIPGPDRIRIPSENVQQHRLMQAPVPPTIPTPTTSNSSATVAPINTQQPSPLTDAASTAGLMMASPGNFNPMNTLAIAAARQPSITPTPVTQPQQVTNTTAQPAPTSQLPISRDGWAGTNAALQYPKHAVPFQPSTTPASTIQAQPIQPGMAPISTPNHYQPINHPGYQTPIRFNQPGPALQGWSNSLVTNLPAAEGGLDPHAALLARMNLPELTPGLVSQMNQQQRDDVYNRLRNLYERSPSLYQQVVAQNPYAQQLTTPGSSPGQQSPTLQGRERPRELVTMEPKKPVPTPANQLPAPTNQPQPQTQQDTGANNPVLLRFMHAHGLDESGHVNPISSTYPANMQRAVQTYQGTPGHIPIRQPVVQPPYAQTPTDVASMMGTLGSPGGGLGTTLTNFAQRRYQ